MVDTKEINALEILTKQICKILDIDSKLLLTAGKKDRKICYAKHMIIYISSKHLNLEAIKKPDVLKKILNYGNRCVVPVSIKKVTTEMQKNAAYRAKSIELLMKIVPNSDVKVPIFIPQVKTSSTVKTKKPSMFKTTFFDD